MIVVTSSITESGLWEMVAGTGGGGGGGGGPPGRLKECGGREEPS